MDAENGASKKRCTTCGETKPLDEFHRDSHCRDGRRAACKICTREQQRTRREQNPERVRERKHASYQRNREASLKRTSEWKRRNPQRMREYGRKQNRARRARKRAVPSEPFTLADIASRDGYRCGVPGCPVRGKRVNMDLSWPHPHSPCIDHIVPLAAGGDDTRANVQLAHLSCNNAKQHRGGGEQLAMFG